MPMGILGNNSPKTTSGFALENTLHTASTLCEENEISWSVRQILKTLCSGCARLTLALHESLKLQANKKLDSHSGCAFPLQPY